MDAILGFAHNTGIYDFMHSAWGWPLTESVHFIGLCLLIGSVGVFDLRMVGVGRGIPIKALHFLVPAGVLGFCLNVITGVMFFVSAPDQYSFNPAFQLKMLFIVLAGVNMLFFYRFLLQEAHATPVLNRPVNSVVLIAVVSMICWAMVILLGRLITYFRPPYYWCFWCG